MFDFEAIAAYVTNKMEEYCDGFTSLPCGIDCIWVDLEEFLGANLGAKIWRSNSDFESQKYRHLRAMVVKIGPKVYREFEIRAYGSYMHKALLMEKLDVAADLIKSDSEEDSDGWTKEEREYRNLVGLDFDTENSLYKEFSQKYNLGLCDMHSKNWGFVRGKKPSRETFRVLDFGHCYEKDYLSIYD